MRRGYQFRLHQPQMGILHSTLLSLDLQNVYDRIRDATSDEERQRWHALRVELIKQLFDSAIHN